MAQEAATTLEEQVRTSYADMNSLYSNSLDTMVASNSALMKGCQQMTSELLSFSQGQLKEGFEVSKRLVASSTFDAAAKVQAEYVKTSLQVYADEYNKLGAMAEAVVKDVFTPIKLQADAVASRMSNPATA